MKKKPAKIDAFWISRAALDRMVPLVSRYVLLHTRLTHITDHETSSPFYAGWRDALHVYRGIPIICLRTVDELQNPESKVQRVIKRAFGFSK